MNQCQLMGRLTRDADVRRTQSGIPVASFTLAVDRRKQKDREQESDFLNIVAWRHLADFVQKYVHKGQRVVVTGAIQTRNYDDKEGNKRYITEIIADNIYFADSKQSDAFPNNQYPDGYEDYDNPFNGN